jgi:hypothetical protein
MRAQQLSQQTRAVRMKVNRRDARLGSAIGDGSGLSSGRGAAIKNTRALADQSRDELRGFILNYAEACSKRGGSGDVTALHSPRRSEESAGSEFDPFSTELVFRFRTTKADCSYRNGLVVLANAKSGIYAIVPDPVFNEP